VTLFMTLLAAFQTLLHDYTGQDDIVVGTFTVDRNRAETEGLIGFFVNNLVLRSDLSGNPTFRELLRRVRELTLGAYAHRDLPFEKLLEELQPKRSLGHTPLFQVMLVLQNTPRPPLESPHLIVRRFQAAAPDRVNFDITLWLSEENDKLTGSLDYNKDLFNVATIHRMLDAIQALLQRVVANPDQRISMLSVAAHVSEKLKARHPGVMERRTKLSPEKQARLEKRLRGELTAASAASNRQKRSKLRHQDSSFQPISHRENRGSAPLSFAQQRLWFLNQLDPKSSFYNVSIARRLSGALNVEALKQTLSAIVARHEILRTIFAQVDGNPVQQIHESQNVGLPVIDLTEWGEKEREIKVKRLLQKEAKRPINLSSDLMLRAILLRLHREEHVLLLVLHHIAFDGWSTGILLQEITALYKAFCIGKPSPLPELPIQYADYAVRQRERLQGEVLEEQLSYWKKQLSGAPPVLELPADRPRPAAQSFRGARQSLELSKVLTEQLKNLSRREGVTLFMTLLAAFETLLYRYSGQDDIVVGTPIANRNLTEIEVLIGFFVNSLVLRTDLRGHPSFRELLARVREVTLGAYSHQDLPFEKLVEETQPERKSSYNPLFQVMFAYQNAPKQALEMPGLTVSPVEIPNETAKFDLSLSMVDTDRGLIGRLAYNTDLFDDTTICRILGNLQTLLKGVVENPERPIAALPILTDMERDQLLVEWNHTKREYPTDRCIHELFQAQVERTPDAIAVACADERLTYRALNTRANQLAHFLKIHGVGPEVLVGICMERSVEMLIGLLGILKAGGAYVPLDLAYPKERLAFMLRDSQPLILLTQQSLVERIPAEEVKVICLDGDWAAIAQNSGENPVPNETPENIAYMIYTSGTMAKPKGVVIQHRSLVNYADTAISQFNLCPGDRILQFAPISFDTAAEEIFPCFACGATLVMRTDSMLDGVPVFLEKCQEWKLTVLDLPTAYWQELTAKLAMESLTFPPFVRLVIIGGERALPEIFATWHEHVGRRVQLVNTYGPTESTIVATGCELGELAKENGASREVPIGRPGYNVQTYILDPYLQPMPIGVCGELHIGGEALGRSYHNRPELTAEKFVPNPFSSEPGARLYRTGDLARYLPDGNIEFLGRMDQQVKIRGFRIELGEIEVVLAQHPSVREVVVVAREEVENAECGLIAEGGGDNPKSKIQNLKSGDPSTPLRTGKHLVAYVVPNPKETPSISELRGFLIEKLPEYMVPTAFVILEALPLTPNGKVDRSALPAPDRGRPDLEGAFVAPRSMIEDQLTRIWEEILGIRPIGVTDNFFDLGGHSLLAVRLFAQIEKEFNKRLPLSSLFQGATVEHLASVISRADPLASRSSLVAIQSQGFKRPFFCVHDFFGNVLCYGNLARHLGQDQPFYALQARGLDGEEEPFAQIEAMATYYIEKIRAIQPEGPYALGGLCIGGVVAFEMAQQLRTKGETVALVALLDSGVNTGYGKLTWWWHYFRNLPRDIPSWLIGSFQLNRAQWATLIRQKIRMTRASLRHAFRSSRDGSHQDDAPVRVQELGDLFQFSEQHRKIARAQYQALRQYKPRVYPGRLSLFRARMQPFFSSHDPEKGWGKLAARGVEIRVVPSNHLGMLQEPHVRVLAKQLRACLDEAQTSDITDERTRLAI
jgi:aspartate racemase